MSVANNSRASTQSTATSEQRRLFEDQTVSRVAFPGACWPELPKAPPFEQLVSLRAQQRQPCVQPEVVRSTTPGNKYNIIVYMIRRLLFIQIVSPPLEPAANKEKWFDVIDHINEKN